MEPHPSRASRSIFVPLVGAMLLAIGGASGCASAEGDDAGGHVTPSKPDSSSSVDAGSPGDTGGGLAVDGALDTPPGPAAGCSGDLHDVIDGAGHVVTTCGPTEGCSKGVCIPACDAAAASKGNVGCDFRPPTPYMQFNGGCFAVFVTNTWSTNAKLTVSRGTDAFDVTKFARVPTTSPDSTSWPALDPSGVPPGQVAVLFLSDGSTFRCDVPTAVDSALVTSTARGQAFHVTSDVPVSAYDVLPFGGARSYLPSAELLMPTSAWGTNFVAVVSPKTLPPYDTAYLPGWAQIVASEDGTTVNIAPTSDLPSSSDVVAAPKGTTTTFTLNAGEYVQWRDTASASVASMSGSVIVADKPIAFHGGSGYLCLPSVTSPGGGGCDSTHQQIPPVGALGYDYAIAPFQTRRKDGRDESIVYRVVGMVDGTSLTFDPPGLPTVLSRGQVLDFELVGPFTITSDKDHPFYVGQLMPGCAGRGVSAPGVDPSLPAEDDCLGDEDHVNVLPPAQYLSRYVFFTDPTYPTTNLVLTRVKGASGFEDVTVDCLGVVGGWKPIGTSGLYEFTTVDLIRAFTPVGSCANGPHSAQSKGAFGLVVWGLDSAASYGYPAGGNAATINTVVVPTPIK